MCFEPVGGRCFLIRVKLGGSNGYFDNKKLFVFTSYVSLMSVLCDGTIRSYSIQEKIAHIKSN